ncbi:hypothetical protein SAMN05192529_11769 [Arachidicoccus rhizosphaerae]|uniref:Uncharacterized protein n=1 Tax=Arachidicoccus rhizosphaerae TaxID=551991 RepID=A0A1H4B047_9BACT|nr:hypothetical protein [Arachidicoccus rhizosphaerae]SEA41500.1 hypothetical protein SAMN05192529_11769 [Arachidicoccus rhizosphaerae]
MTNRVVIENVRCRIRESIQRQKEIIDKLEQLDEQIVELTQMEYQWEDEVDLSLETVHSYDDNLDKSQNWQPNSDLRGVLHGLLLLFITALLLVVVVYCKRYF